MSFPAFSELLSGYDTILTFNGTGFDIPYLKAKCKALHLSDPFDAHSYIDLYKEVSRFKFLFALTSYKQKSIELFLGIDRIDAYSRRRADRSLQRVRAASRKGFPCTAETAQL